MKRQRRSTSTLLFILGTTLPSFHAAFGPQHQPRRPLSTRDRILKTGEPAKKSAGPAVVPTTTARHLEPAVLAGGAAAFGLGTLLWWTSGSEDRALSRQQEEWAVKEREIFAARERRARVAPREAWTAEDLAPYDGTASDDGPLLLAAGGTVFNVWRGRHFYGPGCEYHVFAGRDASRLLAKNRLEEETEEERAVPMNVAERAVLEGWLYIFRDKYEAVGKFEG